MLAVTPERNEVTIKHAGHQGLHAGHDHALQGAGPRRSCGTAQPGDLVTATLVVGEVEAYLSTLTKTGHAVLEAPPATPWPKV